MIKYVGIVGNGEDKFTLLGTERAKAKIKTILQNELMVVDGITVVSGRSPVGGIDIWAEEIADEKAIPTDIKEPLVHRWSPGYGYMARNTDIARSDIVHVIVVDSYPLEYKGKKFHHCYHCPHTNPWHVKSGGCWTGRRAIRFGNDAMWHIIENA